MTSMQHIHLTERKLFTHWTFPDLRFTEPCSRYPVWEVYLSSTRNSKRYVVSTSNITSLQHCMTVENARNFGRKPEEKKPFLRRERKWEYDIKMDIKY
jgi:hypothetical protein